MNTDLANLEYEARALGHALSVWRVIKSGKEATVYRAMLDGRLIALKVYTPPMLRWFRNAAGYVEWKRYRSSSERRAAERRNWFGRASAHERWVAREFFLLRRAWDRDMSVPEPILALRTAVCMEFIGDNEPAPRLRDVELSDVEAQHAFNEIIVCVDRLWQEVGVAHSDLSDYNILWWREVPWIIDFPQAADRRSNPHSESLLVRDVTRVCEHFSRYFQTDAEKILSERFGIMTR